MKSKKSKIIAVSLIALMLLIMLIGALINKPVQKPVEEVSVEEVTEEPEEVIETEEKEAPAEEVTEEPEETVEEVEEESTGKTPFEIHGAIKVEGAGIVDEKGEAFQLVGISTHGLQWFPEYVNEDSFRSLRDDFGANTVRLAMYTVENGYCDGNNKEGMKSTVINGVDIATELGMYVIVDWHILHDLDPNVHKSEAIAFFDEISAKYKDQDNVIYEICNEPNGGTSWSSVKSYAEEVIPVIRANDPNAIIIVGTPTWSQDVDEASKDPVTGYDNIMYAVHFYADTHKDSIRNKVETAIGNGAAIFISEFSICDASGNGHNNIAEANKWIELADKYNLSFTAWNLSNKAESSSIIASNCGKTKGGWNYNELSESGQWLVGVLNTHSDQGAALATGDGTASVSAGTDDGNADGNNGGNGGNNNGNQQNIQSGASGSGSAGNLTVSASTNNTWDAGGKTATQLNLKLENTGSGDVNGWTVTIDVGQSVTVDQIWCAKASASGNTITITPESYNSTIGGGSSYSDVGLIILTNSGLSSDIQLSVK
ncbi:MAG: cellulase family glycosylhydrolase [Lachnospiraceae bacterium]|nr:cellulase family glycosylhydrolase [Lachnospiraceae bacterium]